MRRLLPLLLLAALLGCARPERARLADVHADPVRAAAALAVLPLPDGWLEHSRDRWPEAAESCLVLASALEDTEGSWLWLHLDLGADSIVRVAGPGSLQVTLQEGDRTWTVRDLGLHVPLHRDGNTYLNSESGPITIRPHHGLACDETGVRFLARLPKVDVETVTAVAVAGVPGRWTRRP